MTDRRGFLQTTAGAIAAAGLVSQAKAAVPDDKPKVWKKAFMLGVTEGPIRPHFERLREAGFDGVEMISPNKLDRDEVLKARDATGIVIHGVSGSVHWKDTLSDPDPAVVERGLKAIRREIEDVKAYGGTTVLIVPAVVNGKVSYREAYERSQAAIRKVLPDAEKAGITLAIEEVWNKFLLSSVELARYVDEFNSPHVKAYFDVGNVVEYGYPEEWIRELGKRIAKIHIKEYAKKNRFGYKLGEGEINWPAVKQALHDVGYDGWITAEVGYGDVAELKDVIKRMSKLLDS